MNIATLSFILTVSISGQKQSKSDKTTPTTAQFLYELICRHGCFAIQINDQGRGFVNEVSDELHLLRGVQQRATSAYQPQSNSLVVRQNRKIKNYLVKVLKKNPIEIAIYNSDSDFCSLCQ